MKVFIENNPLFYHEIKYIFNIFISNKKIRIDYTENELAADIVISSNDKSNIRISLDFYKKFQSGTYDHSFYFDKQPYIFLDDGSIDYLSTAFYFLSTIQEVKNNDVDKFGRFKYINSLQYKFGIIKKNIVQELFDDLFKLKLSHKINTNSNFKSKIFLSHDIDSIYGSIIQDSFYNFKKIRLDLVFRILFTHLFYKPVWLNMDKIMKLESEHEFYSTFYWLVNKGKIKNKLSNSDYNIDNKVVKLNISKIQESKWENGLHKSISTESFQTEIRKLGINVKGNRYHYLKFRPNEDFSKIQESGLIFDSSLGFAEEYGFRNGYGQPYKPYNLLERKAFSFIECPLHIMDTTFYNYLKLSAEEFVNCVIEFCELNKENCIISVLIHNNFISDYKYKNYFIAIKKLLSYFNESKLECITQSEIINQYNYEYSN
jgi:hypothetical protein